MNNDFTPLRLQPLGDVLHVSKPRYHYQTGTLYSAAADVMTDFERVLPLEVSDQLSIDDALELMKSQHIRMLIALDAHGVFSGVITAADLMGAKPTAHAEQARVSLNHILVRDVMTKRDQVQVVSIDQVEQAQVGDIMQTLTRSGQQHLLVVDETEAGIKRLRGIISASDISRFLRVSFDVLTQAHSFAEIERVVSQAMHHS